jgi:Rieske Fe-S protein
MPTWKLPANLGELEFGTPHILELREDSETTAGAVLLRIHNEVAGSKSDPEIPGHFIGFGNACTHMGCLLATEDTRHVCYEKPSGSSPQRVVLGPCPCHGTTFDLTREGLVILGPATQNLPQLELDIGALTATGWRNSAIDPRDETWPGSGE